MGNEPTGARRSNLALLGKLAIVAGLMFGFGFAMVPIYRAICDVTGVNFLTRPDDDAPQLARKSVIDEQRSVIVEFDVNARGTWHFRPETRSLTVHPGEVATVTYELVNTQPRAMRGQAIPSYAPLQSGQYFRKIECFCFQQQDFAANETRRFPVVFVIDPGLPKDVGTITLSYTFFEIATPEAPRAAVAPLRGDAS